jgi:orotidine-5'-phosphate decarboxylase
MSRSLIIALDFPGLKETKQFLEPFAGETLFVKVGMELYYQCGPSIISLLKEKGHHIFLDLKLHDIPNTVKRAMTVLASLQVDLVNVHAAGGTLMMQAAIEGLEAGTLSGKKRPHCIAVTQLTSTSEKQMNEEQLIQTALSDSVLHYAKLAKQSGLDGVVCSPHEAGKIHAEVATDFLTVTPGIRLASSTSDDQKRIATPENARNLGSDMIVVGRPITASPDPFSAYKQILQAWEGTPHVK